MKNETNLANLANSVVTQRVIELYEAVPNALAMEVRMMERNPEDRDNEMLLPYYKKALEHLQKREAALARVAREHRMMHPNWHPENGMD